MITELATLGTSFAMGGGFTMASNIVNAGLDAIDGLGAAASERKREEHERKMQAQEASEKSTLSARAFKGTPGFHKTRQWIAKRVIWCYFIAPIVVPLMGSLIGVPVAFNIGYYDISQGWPWQESVENIEWVTLGVKGGITIVMTPVMNHCVLTIVGFFFGNQVAKRG